MKWSEEFDKEFWKPVVGMESLYSISNLGRVRSERVGRGTKKGLILKNRAGYTGYIMVTLYQDKAKTFTMHRLVADAFLGKRPDGKEVNHKDGVKANNKSENLEYMTRLENKEHARNNGLTARGTRHGSNKLTEDQVRNIRVLLCEEGTIRGIAEYFRISPSTVFAIKHRKIWKYI